MYSKNVYIFEELVYDNKRKILALNILRCEHLSREKETGVPVQSMPGFGEGFCTGLIKVCFHNFIKTASSNKFSMIGRWS